MQEQTDHNQPASTTAGSDEFTRLYIAPLDPQLFNVVVSAAVQPRARNISYHSIETFPERRYGFVELPKIDADKLRAKLNGATLRGHKLRIETARPEEIIEPHGEDTMKEPSTSAEGSRKRKREANLVDGVKIDDRKVKRGWSEVPDHKNKKKRKDKTDKDSAVKKEKKEKKTSIKSKYTEGEECLLKVKIPDGGGKPLPDEDSMQRKKRKKKDKERDVVVHEFEKMTKYPSFLRDAPSTAKGQAASEFIEGKGWVDEEGNIVEAVTLKKPPPKAAKKPKSKKVSLPEPVIEEEEDSDTSSSGTSSEEESEESGADQAPGKTVKIQTSEAAGDSGDSSSASDTSRDEEEEEVNNDKKVTEKIAPSSAIKADKVRPVSSSSTTSLKIKIPAPTDTSSTEVHPLEALYKKKKDGKTEDTTAQPFSFFGGADVEEEDAEQQQEEERPRSRRFTTPMPLTPFTKQEFDSRNLRSAAPTPDTAHPSRMANFWPTTQGSDDEMDDVIEEEEEEEEEAEAEGEQGAAPDRSTSDFQSWFWENRRDLNRSWMGRRKTVAKEKRHRENKARASRAV